MKKIISALVSVSLMVFTLLYCASVRADDTNNPPTALLKSLADKMIAELQANKATLKSHPSLVYKFANRIVVPHADLDTMSRHVLPARTWAKATPEQRAQFQKEFTTTLIRTYASALAQYSDETVKFFPIRGGWQGKNTVKVNSEIVRSDGPSIAVTYDMVRRGSQWKLFDMTVEGISMLQSFRSQFADKLDQEDIGSLIKDIAAHNSEHDA